MKLISIAGSPSPGSRSTWLLRQAACRLGVFVTQHREIIVRDLPSEGLLTAQVKEPRIAHALSLVAEADILAISTPIYKAAYSGVLKAFLDLLPQDGLRGKAVLPLATGGSPGHLLALDYALKPVLSALGVRHIADAVYATDAQLVRTSDGAYESDPEVMSRLDRAVAGLLDRPLPGRPKAAAAEMAWQV